MEKKQKLNLLISQQQKATDELRRSMEQYRDSADLDEDDIIDPEDLAQQAVAKESQLRLQQQLNRARADLDLLEDYASRKCRRVEEGALVQTDSQWFLVGLSLGGYDTGPVDIRCISIDSPAFKLMHGKAVNDSFILGETSYRIMAIE